MTSLSREGKSVQPIYAVALLAIVLLFVGFVVYMAKGVDWFGSYEAPVISSAPMLVVQDDSLLIFLPGSTYYKFPNKAAQARNAETQGVLPAPIILPTAVPPKAQP